MPPRKASIGAPSASATVKRVKKAVKEEIKEVAELLEKTSLEDAIKATEEEQNEVDMQETKPKKRAKKETSSTSTSSKPLFTKAVVEANVRPDYKSLVSSAPAVEAESEPKINPQHLNVSYQPKHSGTNVTHESSSDQYIIPTNSFDTIQFTFMSTEEVLRYSVLEITNQKIVGPNSLFDTRLGPSSMNDTCATCKSRWKVCPGHFGHITLPVKVPHPLRMKNIVEYLSLFCFDCYRLVITPEKMKLCGISNKTGEAKFRALLQERITVTNTCSHCNATLPDFSFDDDYKFYRKYKNRTFPVQIKEIENIFDNIPDIDIAELGLDSVVVHPSHLLIGAVLVIPPCARSYVKNASGINHDDLTYKYQEIIKCVAKYHEPSNNPKVKQDTYDSICYHVRVLMDNSKGKAKNVGHKRGIKSIKQRMISKSGLIRGHIQGKRVDFTARSVITPEATTWVDELVVPEVFAKSLSYPVRVTNYNLMKCQAWLDQDKVNNIIRDGESYNASKKIWSRGFELRENDVILRTNQDGSKQRIDCWSHKQLDGQFPAILPGDEVQRHNKIFTNVKGKERLSNFKLRPGDVVERQLMNGDWTLFNRQPTLWKGSMRAMKIKVMPGKTFRFNLACTAAFNADFDGGK